MDKYFIYSDCCGFETFATIDERDKAAQQTIAFHLKDTWSEEVTDIVAGKITHQTVQINREERPDNLDENDCDGDGCWWSPDWAYKCAYELQKSSLLYSLRQLCGSRVNRRYRDDN